MNFRVGFIIILSWGGMGDDIKKEDDSDATLYIVVVVLGLVLVAGGLFAYFKMRKRNRSKKLEEEINKLQQYVNSCDRKEHSKIAVNTQQQILSQTNSFTKTNRMMREMKQTGKMFMDFEKSEREIMN